MIITRDYIESDYSDVKSNLQEVGLFIQEWDTQDKYRIKNQKQPGSIIVAENDGTVVGNIFLLYDGWGAFIFHLAVRKSHQHLGTGKMLMDEAEKRLKENGADLVCLCLESNSETQPFYENRGYSSFGEYLGLAKRL